MDLRLLSKIYKGADNLSVVENCSLTHNICRNCTEECPARATLVKRFGRVIGWVDKGGRINKTNPNPSKRYRHRVLGIKRQRDEKRVENTNDLL